MNLQRISIITETYRPEVNGVANTLGHIVDGLVARGIQVQVIRPRQNRQDTGDHIHGVANVLLPGLPIPGYGSLKFGLPAWRRVKKSLIEFSPDSIYVATEGPLGLVAVKAANNLGIPVVSGFHTNFHQYFSHYHLSLMTPLVYRYLRYFHNRTQTTLAPTKKLQSQLSGFGFENVHIMSRGVDATLFTPEKRDVRLRAQWGMEEDELAVLYVGRLAAEKNIDLAVKAFSQMRSEDNRLRFVLVGDGPLMSRLKEEHPDFIFAGTQRGEDLARYYASGDLFLFPSKTDTFGNVVLEAMASGLAVVAFDYAAAHQHIRNEETGLVVPLWTANGFESIGDESTSENEDYADLAQSLVNRPNLLKRVRQGARLHAESISWSRIVDQFCQHMSKEKLRHGPSKESVVI